MLGFLNLNKPAGFTSHDCVAKVRKLLKLKRVGHGGTLDPSATGVLPIAVGKATRLLQFLPEPKVYLAKIRFGIRTTTDDLEGEAIQSQPASQLTKAQVERILPQFEGRIEQTPPAYSAIQRGGKRLYELARAGEQVKLPLRNVQVHQVKFLAWHSGDYPELELEIACGPGTYIRAIARDIGALLGVGGTLAALTRAESCGFKLDQSLTFEEIETQLQQDTFSLIPPELALEHLEAIELATEEAKRWCQGQKIESSTQRSQRDTQAGKNQMKTIRVRREDGNFLGIGKLTSLETGTFLIPQIVLS